MVLRAAVSYTVKTGGNAIALVEAYADTKGCQIREYGSYLHDLLLLVGSVSYWRDRPIV